MCLSLVSVLFRFVGLSSCLGQTGEPIESALPSSFSVFQDASEGGTPHSSTRLFIVATLQDGPHPSWLLDTRNALSPAFVADQEKLFEKVRALL